MDQIEKNKGLKDFSLTTLSLKNKTTVVVLLFIILILGISSYLGMPREAFPEVVIPQIFVGTPKSVTYVPQSNILNHQNLLYICSVSY